MIAFADTFPSRPPERDEPAVDSSSERLSAPRQRARRDAGLVRRFNAGDEAAFIEIMTCYREQMFGVAFGMLRNRADAEEVTQDIFIRAHRALAKFRGESSLATWLHCIARNLASNRYWYFFRRCRHATISFDSAFNDDNPATFADLVVADTASPMRAAAANEFSDLVTAKMKRLEPAAREILTLRNSLHHSYAEISRETGLNIGTVKSRLARARETLRVLLAEAYPESGPDARPADWFDLVHPGGEVEIISA